MKKLLTIALILHSTFYILHSHAAFTRLATETYPGGGGGPTGGVSKAYVDAHDLATLNSAKTYADTATLAATNFVKAGYLPLDGSMPMTGSLKMIGNTILFSTCALAPTGTATRAGITFGGRFGKSDLFPDNSPVVTSNMLNGVLAAYQTNLVVSAETADKVLKNDGTTLYWGEGGGGGGGSPLAGAQYNFHNGTNFTWTIYATLTNALVKMGATVTNPPALDESTLVHPIVVTASTATGSPLAGKTYDFHGGTNFVKSVYQALEQAVRDLGATTINTPTF